MNGTYVDTIPKQAIEVFSQPQSRIPDPTILVIFGASGDLTKRKLLPALFHLEQSGLLPEEFAVVGVARRDLTATFAADMRAGIIDGGVRSNVFIQRVIDQQCAAQMGIDLFGAVENQLGPAIIELCARPQCAAHEARDIGGVCPLDHRRSDLCVVFAFGDKQSG